MKKNLRPIFSPIIEHEKVEQKQFKRVRKVFWQLLCKRYHHFFETLEVDRNKHLKKYMFSGDKKFGPLFPRTIGHDKSQETFLKGQKLIWPLL